MPWVTSFKYLGSLLSSDLPDTPNTTARVKAAAKAYGALSRILRDKSIAMEVRARLYVQLVIPVLLYGSECWRLSTESKRVLATFHHGCCRKIVGVSRWRQWKLRVSTVTIAETMGAMPIEWYIAKRSVKWIGHLARMPDTRLPKQLLFAWPAGGASKLPTGLLEHPGAKNRGCFAIHAHRTITFMKEPVQVSSPEIAARFATTIGKEDERFDCERERIVGTPEYYKRLKRRIERAGITWRVGVAVARGVRNWAPYASWMVVAGDREAWKVATDALLQNEEYDYQTKR